MGGASRGAALALPVAAPAPDRDHALLLRRSVCPRQRLRHGCQARLRTQARPLPRGYYPGTLLCRLLLRHCRRRLLLSLAVGVAAESSSASSWPSRVDDRACSFSLGRHLAGGADGGADADGVGTDVVGGGSVGGHGLLHGTSRPFGLPLSDRRPRRRKEKSHGRFRFDGPPRKTAPACRTMAVARGLARRSDGRRRNS
ncbi:unnamed protein product, partial [Ectocarpus sp. 12 AP-2014]